MKTTLLYNGKPTKPRRGDCVHYDPEHGLIWFTRQRQLLKGAPDTSSDHKTAFEMEPDISSILAPKLQRFIGLVTGLETSILRCDARRINGLIIIQLHKPKKGTAA